MFRSVLVFVLVSSSVCFAADSAGRSIKAAADAVEDAFDRTEHSNPSCRQSIGAQLDALVDRVDELRRGTTDQQLNALRLELSQVGASASRFGCPLEVNDDVHTAVAHLDDARAALWSNSNSKPGKGRDRRYRRNGEPYFTEGRSFVQLSELQIDTRSRVDTEGAVRVTVPELKAFNLQGTQFYMAAKFRSYEGDWSEWVTTPMWTIPTDSFSWKNAFNHSFRYSTLAEDDFSRGRFIAHVSVFDNGGRELAFHEAKFEVRLPNLPPPPPPMPVRDCGTGRDPGCLMTRDGQYPMDAATFAGVMTALRTNGNELVRADLCNSLFNANYLTAAHLGQVLDLFNNELIRLDVAKKAADHVVNPQHALALASKFRNSFTQQDFVRAMTTQR